MPVDISVSQRQADMTDSLLSNINQWAEKSNRGGIRAVPLTAFTTISPRKLEQWLLLGMGTCLYVGDNAIGKSATALWTAARVTNGTCDGELHDPANVLLLLSEDAPGIIRPKLEALGADMDRVFIVVCTQPGESHDEGTNYLRLPAQGDALEQLIVDNHIRLMILDALADCFERPDVNKTENVAPVLTFLNHLSSKYELAVIGVHHTKKNTEGGAKNSVRGSKAFTDKARQVVSFVKDDAGYGFQVTKCNFMEDNPAWRYTLVSAPTGIPGKTTGIISDPVPALDLDVDKTMRQAAIGANDNGNDSIDVTDWLTDYLREGPAPFKEILEAASDEGYTKAQLRHAQYRATNPRIESVTDPSYEGRGQRRVWRLSNSAQGAPDRKMGTNGHKSETVVPVGVTNSAQLVPNHRMGTNQNTDIPESQSSYSLHLERLHNDQANAIIDSYRKRLATDPKYLDEKITRMSPGTLQLLTEHGDPLKTIADREFQRRHDQLEKARS